MQLAAEAKARDDGSETETLSDLVNNQNVDGDPGREQKDEFWHHPATIDGARWDQKFPYQLLVMRRENGSYVPMRDWKFTLPVAPEAMTISMPFASSTNVTLGGIVEEHAGAPIRVIQIAGTTGVMTDRPAAAQRRAFNSLSLSDQLGSVFAGTAAAARRTFQAAQDLKADVLGEDKNSPSVMTEEEVAAFHVNTGYYQFRLLTRFLEDYARLKQTSDGRRAVLAFATWKDEAVYLVTPVTFDLNRSATSPYEYPYRLTLRAWRRIEPSKSSPLRDPRTPTRQDPSTMAKILNDVNDARRVLQDAKSTIKAVGGDVGVMLEGLREVVLLLKDALGVPLTLFDLPSAIIQDLGGPVIEAISLKQDVGDFGKLVQARNNKAKEDLEHLKLLVSEQIDRRTSSTGISSRPTGQAPTAPSRAPLAAVPGAVRKAQERPGFDVFSNPSDHSEFLSVVEVNRVKVPKRTQDAIVAERRRVAALTRADFEAIRQLILATATLFADAVGAGSATFNRTMGLPDARPTRSVPLGDFRTIFALNKAALAVAGMSAFGRDAAEESRLAGLEQMASLAAAAGIPFTVPRSKFAVPFPFGHTLERLALDYLGDPDRWNEIAALNNLRSPYIDEEGFVLVLLAPGSGNQVVVEHDIRIHVGQTVWVESDAATRTKRRVEAVDRTGPQQMVLTLDGEADLGQYSTLANARLQAFLPGTVNSQMLVFIPSSDEPDGGFKVQGIPDAVQFDSMTAVGGVDLLLTPKNDLVVTSDGDGRWAVGMTNLVQQFRILVGIQQGGLLRHPEVGMPLRPGDSTADVSARDVARAVRSTLAVDPGFQTVREVRLLKQGPAAKLTVAVEVTGADITLPLSVDLLR
jgi:hypothetical protein